jgi:outer membrane lipoprotein-sorting protein
MKRNILLVLLFITSIGLLAQDKASVFKELQNKFKGINSVSFSFKDVDSKYSGTISSEKGNKYKIKSNDRVITCNGKKIYNYTPNDNKVLVSNFDENNPTLSIEKFFFEFINVLTPESITKEHSTKATNGLILLSLKAEENFAKKNKIKNIKIWLDKSNEIQYIAFNFQNKEQFYKIENLKTNIKIKKDFFKFKAPAKCQIIELD